MSPAEPTALSPLSTEELTLNMGTNCGPIADQLRTTTVRLLREKRWSPPPDPISMTHISNPRLSLKKRRGSGTTNKELISMSMMRSHKYLTLGAAAALTVTGLVGCGDQSTTVTRPDTSNLSVEPMAPPPGFSGAGRGGKSAPAAQSIQAAPSD